MRNSKKRSYEALSALRGFFPITKSDHELESPPAQPCRPLPLREGRPHPPPAPARVSPDAAALLPPRPISSGDKCDGHISFAAQGISWETREGRGGCRGGCTWSGLEKVQYFMIRDRLIDTLIYINYLFIVLYIPFPFTYLRVLMLVSPEIGWQPGLPMRPEPGFRSLCSPHTLYWGVPVKKLLSSSSRNSIV